MLSQILTKTSPFWKTPYIHVSQRRTDVIGNFCRQHRIRISRKYFHFCITLAVHCPLPACLPCATMVARPGIEPELRASKTRVLPLHHRAASSLPDRLDTVRPSDPFIIFRQKSLYLYIFFAKVKKEKKIVSSIPARFLQNLQHWYPVAERQGQCPRAMHRSPAVHVKR